MSGLTSASQNVASLVAEQASLRPASPAIISYDQVITYGRLEVLVGVLATYLKHKGIAHGQVVGVSMYQNSMHIITLLALAQVGAVSLPLHVAVPADRRLLAARRFGATCVVSGMAEMALPNLDFISLGGLVFDGTTVKPDRDTYPVSINDPFRIAISSGTSGDPKGMVLTHGVMVLRNQRREEGFDATSRMLPMDMAFIAGFGTTLRTFATGGSVVLPRSHDPDEMLHTFVRHGVTHTLLSPAQASSIVDRLAHDDIYCPSLKSLKIVGGSMSPELLSALRRKVSRNVFAGYGSTESGSISIATPEILERQPASVGRVQAWVKLEIVDDEGRPVPNGKIGNIRISSEHQVSGYYLDPVRSEKNFRDGWFYPGDLGGYDEDGLLYIEGRADDQLNVGGLKINPEDIDAALAADPAVVEAGAFVLAWDEGGEFLAAAIVLREGGRLVDVESTARKRLGPLAPQRYFVVPELPRTITGKLQRVELSIRFYSATDSVPVNEKGHQ